MFGYELKGKQVILVLDPAFVKQVKPLGITGSPVVARVFKTDDDGVWLDNPSFAVCPVGVPKLYDARGEVQCHAHVFVPERAILSVAAFPTEVPRLEEDPSFKPIGFQPKDMDSRPRARPSALSRKGP